MASRPTGWLNQGELAARWGLSPHTLEAWRSRRRGPAYLKIGGRVHYRLEDIEAWEAEQVRLNFPSPAHAAFGVGGTEARKRRGENASARRAARRRQTSWENSPVQPLLD
jgi:hypothetical protein